VSDRDGLLQIGSDLHFQALFKGWIVPAGSEQIIMTVKQQ
jgi:hypothetical protein